MNPNRADDVVVAYPLFQAEDGGSIPTSALALTLYEIPVKTALLLNRMWHSRLPLLDESNVYRNRNIVCYGAEHANRWWAVAIWTSPVSASLDRESVLELRRFAIAPMAPPNTGSRLLAIMRRLVYRKFADVTLLLSYQDIAVHNGPLYRAAGWQCKGLTDSRGSRRRGGLGSGYKQAPGRKLRWEAMAR